MIFVLSHVHKGYVECMADGTIPPELYGKYLNIILFETGVSPTSREIC